MNYYSTANQNKDECPGIFIFSLFAIIIFLYFLFIDDLLNIEKKEDDNNKDENKFM